MTTHDNAGAAESGVLEQPISRRGALRLALGSASAAATGPLLAHWRPVRRQPRAGRSRAPSAGVVSGTAPMAGPAVPKFVRDLPILEKRPGGLLSAKVPGSYTAMRESFDGVEKDVHYYDIVQKVSTHDFLPAPFPRTEIWAYNGMYPGPVFRQEQNGPYTVVRNVNKLPLGHGTSTHLHGSPTQPAHDGHPDDETYPDGTPHPEPLSKFVDDGKTEAYCPEHVYRYPNHEETRTLWYHDHGMHQTAEQVYKGLVGMFIQEPDADELARFPGLAKLPKGDYDVPLIVADMQFNTRGEAVYDDGGHDSLWGNVQLVNGYAWPKMKVDATRYRFRVLVADLSRGYLFQLSTPSGVVAPTMTMIATDAGMLKDPAPVTSWRQGMAERYEVVIDFTGLKAGQKVTLLNMAADGAMRQIMQFVGTGLPGDRTSAVQGPLNDYRFGQDWDLANNRSNPRYFRLERSNGMWVINGLPWDGRIAAAPTIDTSEVWVLENKSGGWFHPVHIHLVDFHVLRRNGRTPPAYEQGWKDVVYVGPNERVELVMRFKAAVQMDPDTVARVRPQADHRQVRHALPQPGPRGPRHDDAVQDPAGRRHRARRGDAQAAQHDGPVGAEGLSGCC